MTDDQTVFHAFVLFRFYHSRKPAVLFGKSNNRTYYFLFFFFFSLYCYLVGHRLCICFIVLFYTVSPFRQITFDVIYGNKLEGTASASAVKSNTGRRA